MHGSWQACVKGCAGLVCPSSPLLTNRTGLARQVVLEAGAAYQHECDKALEGAQLGALLARGRPASPTPCPHPGTEREGGG